MDCSPGQVNLNHSDAGKLQSLPGVSAPIAQRIIAMRPHDRVQDLLVVPGIGPDKMEAIRAGGNACSTPLTLPPPSADACTSTDQADVNDRASGERLAALFGGPTAQRIIAAQPFPDLAHARVVLAAGAGPGKVDKYAARLCATPVPKTTGGVNFSYVYSATGGRGDLGKFSLVIPPKTLTDPIGQWLRIAPQKTPTPDLDGPAWPSADFSVLGSSWRDGKKHVYVTLPIDPQLSEFGQTADPVIAHYDSDTRGGGEIAATQADRAAGTITAAVTHLSLLDSISQGVAWVSEPLVGLLTDGRFPAPTCDGSWKVNASTGSWARGTARVDLIGALLNLPGNTVPPFGWPQKHCVAAADSGEYDARLRLVNNTRTFESLTRYSGNPKLDNADPIGADPLQLVITAAAEGVLRHPVAYPGAEVGAEVPSGQSGAVRMTPNIPITAFWAVVNETPFADVLDEIGNDSPATNAIIKNGFGCVLSKLDALASLDSSSTQQLDALAGFLKSCIDFESIKVAILEAEHAGRIAPEKVGRLGVALNKLQRYVLWLKVGRIAVSGYDSWLGYAGGSSAGIIDVENYAPRPTVDTQGRAVFDKCVKPRGLGWVIDVNCENAAYEQVGSTPQGSGGSNGFPKGKIVRNASGNAWWVNNDAHVIQPIADGGTYLCLAKHYAVDWDGSLAQYQDKGNALGNSNATCDGSIPDDRPINHGETGDQAIVLREGDGTAWVVWNGQREWVPTGDEFRCWVNPKYTANIEFDVWDQVTDAQLANWPVMPPGNYVSNCGDPANPTF
jgi:hypothetical protein